jgi:hypothetical protein
MFLNGGFVVGGGEVKKKGRNKGRKTKGGGTNEISFL